MPERVPRRIVVLARGSIETTCALSRLLERGSGWLVSEEVIHALAGLSRCCFTPRITRNDCRDHGWIWKGGG